MKKSVLVTGASRGIGRAIALELAAAGFDIVVHFHRKEEAAQKTASEVRAKGVDARMMQFDISDRERCREMLLSDIAAHGAYFGVVCNAGITADAPFPAMTDEAWDSVIRTNLDGFYNVLRPLVMPMVQMRSKGRIVTISSLAGLMGNRGQVNYSAAKAGIIGATKALAQELAKREIAVNCVAPGIIATDMAAEAPVDEIIKHVPMRRIGQPEEVAALVAFLFSEQAGYITGQVISINGGIA